MKIQAIKHAEFEGIGVIEKWAKENNYSVHFSNPYKGDLLPNTNDFDMLLIMGGPQSACELDKYPYLKEEISLIKEAINQEKYVIGFCLGAQLIAESLGAKTLKSENIEKGIFSVELTDAGKKDPILKHFGDKFEVAHWHCDMPGIPEGAELLAKSEGCSHQAFRYNEKTYGFQFHFEMTRQNLKDIISHLSCDASEGKYVQSEDQMMQHDIESINEKMITFLNQLTANKQELITNQYVF